MTSRKANIWANFGYVWGNYAQNITQTFYEDGTATSASNGLRRQIEADLSSYKIDIGVQYPIKIGKNTNFSSIHSTR